MSNQPFQHVAVFGNSCSLKIKDPKFGIKGLHQPLIDAVDGSKVRPFRLC